MLTLWTQSIKSLDEKAKFEDYVKHSTQILDRLREIISDREASIDRSEVDESTYDTASWSHKQAHKNGRRAELRYLDTILNLDLQKKD